MNHPVVSSLFPVVLMIALGLYAGRRGLIAARSVKDLSALVFYLLSPALLFRSMSAVRVQDLDLRPVAAYFIAAGVIFALTVWHGRFTRRASVIAMANTYSNSVMIGIPLIGLAYGPAGMVTLLALISLHALVLLSTATLSVELAIAREAGAAGGERPRLLKVVAPALRSALIHPVPIPIVLGLLFGQTGWVLPEPVDKTLQVLGQAFAPLALIMVGITLATTAIGPHLRAALGMAAIKNLLHPALVAALGWALGLAGLPLVVMVVAAAMPMGANVFIFAQRYETAEDLGTAAVAVSTVMALASVPIVMLLMGR
jgi:malonate transporter